MTDTTIAINYIKQTVAAFELKEDELHRRELDIEAQKKKLVAELSKLNASKSAFYSQTAELTAENEKAKKLHDLATKMKAQVDEDREDLKVKRMVLDEREKAIIDLENKQKELEAREELLKSREADVENREIIVQKDKEANRSKQHDLELREKQIKVTQTRLQSMINRTVV